MPETQFTLNFGASSATSNISYLLDSKHQEFLNTFTPVMIEDVFGPGNDSCDEISKGYTDPEWYWQASNGCVWGIVEEFICMNVGTMKIITGYSRQMKMHVNNVLKKYDMKSRPERLVNEGALIVY